MKNTLFVILFFWLFLTSIKLTAQKKVWNDDKAAVVKVDTQQVNIDGRDYRKFVTVTYEEVTKDALKNDFRQKREELANLQAQKDDIDVRIEKLRLEMDDIKSLFSAYGKSKKWKEKEVDEPEPMTADQIHYEKIKADFLANPRRPK